MNKSCCITALCLFLGLFSYAQKTVPVVSDSLGTGFTIEEVVFESKTEINPLAPSKASFYSAIFPGLGQAYNKSYWKIPLVYAAIGTGVYAYSWNNKSYKRFRTAFKRRRAGFTDDEFYDINGSGIVIGNPDLSDAALEDAQERYQRDRDLSLLVTIGLYALNIIEANVDSHLQQFNVNDDLSFDFQPYIDRNPVTNQANYGLALIIDF